MANALVGKRSVTWTFVAPDDEAAEVLRTFFDGHMDFMKEKCKQVGDEKLIIYYVSEAPEYSDKNKQFLKWFSGKYPKKTGRIVFTLNEIYEKEDGLHHHYIESEPFREATMDIINEWKIELTTYNQMIIRQSLWD